MKTLSNILCEIEELKKIDKNYIYNILDKTNDIVADLFERHYNFKQVILALINNKNCTKELFLTILNNESYFYMSIQSEIIKDILNHKYCDINIIYKIFDIILRYDEDYYLDAENIYLILMHNKINKNTFNEILEEDILDYIIELDEFKIRNIINHKYFESKKFKNQLLEYYLENDENNSIINIIK